MHHNIFQYGTIPIFGIPMQKIALKVEILVSPYKILLYLQYFQSSTNILQLYIKKMSVTPSTVLIISISNSSLKQTKNGVRRSPFFEIHFSKIKCRSTGGKCCHSQNRKSPFFPISIVFLQVCGLRIFISFSSHLRILVC